MKRIVLLLLVVIPAIAQDRFAYDADAPYELELMESFEEDGVRVEHIAYPSPRGGDVPATIISPEAEDVRGPAVVFVHWGLGDRHGWIDDAKLLAKYGAVSLLIDAPFQRKRDGAPQGEANEIIQTVVDVQRGIDLLQRREDVDGERIAFVGLSFGAHIGAILSNVEPRIRALVLMGGLASNSESMEGDQRKAMAALDAEKWVSRPRASSVFLQFATRDEYISRAQANRYTRAAGRASITKWYDGSHELIAPSRDDRMQWLAANLGLTIDDPTYHQIDANGLGVVLEVPGMQQVTVREGEVDVYYPFGLHTEPETLRVPAILFVTEERKARSVTTAARAIAARANRIVVAGDVKSTKELDELIAYVREHADELQIDRDQLGILARSAIGAHAWNNKRPYIKAVSLQYPDVRAIRAPREKGAPPLLLVTAEHDPAYDAKAVAALKVEHLHLANGDYGYDYVDDTDEARAALLKTIVFLRSHLPIRR